MRSCENESLSAVSPAAAQPVLAVPLSVSREGKWCVEPVMFGIPLPKGLLHAAGMATLSDGSGAAHVCQTDTLARWSDGSVKWLLVDTILASPPATNATLLIVPRCEDQVPAAPSAGRSPGCSVAPTVAALPSGAKSPGAGPSHKHFVIDTQAGRFHIQCAGQRMVQWENAGSDVQATLGMRLIDANGRPLETHLGRLEIETAGPLRTTLVLTGQVRRSRAIRFKLRLCFFHQTGLVRAAFTLHNAGRARRRGGLWDLGDRGSFLFRELSLEIALPQSDSVVAEYAAEPGEAGTLEPMGSVEIYQDSSGGENWSCRNHVNRDGRVPCQFRGYRLRTPCNESGGLRAAPVIAMQGKVAGLAVAVPEFWQQFPKRLAVDGGRLQIGLFPAEWNDLHELQGGEQKTHTFWLNFQRTSPLNCNTLAWVHQPTRIMATPAWTAETHALAWFLPATADSDLRLQGLLNEALRGEESLSTKREMIDEYGWRNYGDIYADHEAQHYHGPKPVISHYNNQFDLIYGFILQWLRTADAGWYELADSLARHVADIDIYHTTEDRTVYNGGLFWFTDHYLDAATASHRTYSRHNCPRDGSSYGGGPSPEHNYTTGLLHYYYLTGNAEAREAVISLADWIVAMEDGRNNVLGLADPGPTGLATHRSDANRHALNRAAGNSVNALVDVWLLTGRDEYLHLAEALIKRVVHPRDNIAALDLLQAEAHWSYTVFLSALAKYLLAKEEADDLDQEYLYSRVCLLRYAAWMLDNERPYFDRADELQYPTEAWAAQDFRKANVLRLAAPYADKAQRRELLERGAQLAERAWSDLLSFESRTTARAIAVVMTEGVRDQYFRGQCPDKPFGELSGIEWPPRAEFITQRSRVLQRLRSPLGWAKVAAGVMNVQMWRQTLLRF